MDVKRSKKAPPCQHLQPLLEKCSAGTGSLPGFDRHCLKVRGKPGILPSDSGACPDISGLFSLSVAKAANVPWRPCRVVPGIRVLRKMQSLEGSSRGIKPRPGPWAVMHRPSGALHQFLTSIAGNLASDTCWRGTVHLTHAFFSEALQTLSLKLCARNISYQ